MLSKERAIEKLNQQIEAIPKLKQQESFSPEFTKWRRDTQVLIEKIFGEGTRHIKDFGKINFSVVIASNLTPPSAFQEAYRDGLDKAKSIL